MKRFLAIIIFILLINNVYGASVTGTFVVNSSNSNNVSTANEKITGHVTLSDNFKDFLKTILNKLKSLFR